VQLLTGGWIDHRFCCLWHPWHVKGTARLLYSGMSLGWPEKSFRINYNTYLFFIYSYIIYIMTSNCRYTQILQLDQSSLKLTLLRSVKASQTVGQACTTRSASLEKALSGWKWLDLEMLTVYRQISWHPMNILDIYIIWCMMMDVLFGIYMGKHNDHIQEITRYVTWLGFWRPESQSKHPCADRPFPMPVTSWAWRALVALGTGPESAKDVSLRYPWIQH
jgi:hypothetical protein